MLDKTIAASRALVIDPNPTSRSMLCSQLRDLGVGSVVQTGRVRDARGHLETRPFDIVLCEMDFRDGGQTGQQLLDELRRDGLMPLSTVFVMVTGEASYARVAEAAEAGLDSYLLKPFTQVSLMERLQRSRRCKADMMDVLSAVDAGQFELAARLCLQRVQERSPQWLYAARIGAELLLRLDRHDAARRLLEAVVEAQALPWARLGIARAQIAAQQVQPAMTTLSNLIAAEPNFADAYDVMGRAQLQQGDLAGALVTYRKGADITPGSIGRLQKLGMLAFYMGDVDGAGRALERAVAIGLSSKSFDPQALVLLAMVRYHQADSKALRRCLTDLSLALERQPDSLRLQRFAALVRVFELLMQRQAVAAVAETRQLAQELRAPGFDVEAACNMLALVARLVGTEIQLPEADGWVETIAMRFCTTKGVTEMLVRAAGWNKAHGEIVREVHARLATLMEHAMTHSLGGDPAAATHALLEQAHATLNPRFADAARRMLERHGERIADAAALAAQIDAVAGATPPVAGPPLGRDGLDGSVKLRAGPMSAA